MFRKNFLLCTWFVLSCGMGWSAYASNIPTKLKPQAPTDIGTRSIVRVPFAPTGGVGFLNILCLADLGTVWVEVQDEQGNVVYEEENVMAIANNTWSIAVDAWALGGYTLSIITTNGAMYQWTFELEEEE